MRDSLKQKIIQVCHQKIARKGEGVGVSFYAFFANRNDDPELLMEAATLFTGWLMDVNPLDQPAVELGKRLANARLGAPGYATEHADLDTFMAVPTQEQAF